MSKFEEVDMDIQDRMFGDNPGYKEMRILEEFKRYAYAASHCYADDSCREWGEARQHKNKALEIFDAHPELEEEFRDIGFKQLWSLNTERPKEANDE